MAVMRPRHIPTRACVVCGERAPKRELFRVTASGSRVAVDLSGRASGRGAYLCRDEGGSKAPRMRARLAHALRTEISDEDWDGLKESLDEAVGTGN